MNNLLTNPRIAVLINAVAMRKKNDLGRRVACSALSAALAISMCPMVPIKEAIAEPVDEKAGSYNVSSSGDVSGDAQLSDTGSESLSDQNERRELMGSMTFLVGSTEATPAPRSPASRA